MSLPINDLPYHLQSSENKIRSLRNVAIALFLTNPPHLAIHRNQFRHFLVQQIIHVKELTTIIQVQNCIKVQDVLVI